MIDTNNPLVSVVLCTYNDEKYIKETIDSVLCQTFIDFEFIIWNDGSTDSTENIVKSFEDGRIRYFYHENTGLGKALALACKEARGKYIARIDGDDICMPCRLEKEVDFLESHHDVVLVSSSVVYIDDEGKEIGKSYPWTWNRNLKRNVNIVHPAAMFRRDVYEQTCGYQDIKSAQDRILWSKMAKFGKFSNIETPLIKYRWVPTSLSHSIDSKSPYSRALEIVRKKMCSDSEISPVDIELHNQLYMLAKAQGKGKEGDYHLSIEEIIHRQIKFFFGDKIATSFVCFLKNIYAYIMY